MSSSPNPNSPPFSSTPVSTLIATTTLSSQELPPNLNPNCTSQSSLTNRHRRSNTPSSIPLPTATMLPTSAPPGFLTSSPFDTTSIPTSTNPITVPIPVLGGTSIDMSNFLPLESPTVGTGLGNRELKDFNRTGISSRRGEEGSRPSGSREETEDTIKVGTLGLETTGISKGMKGDGHDERKEKGKDAGSLTFLSHPRQEGTKITYSAVAIAPTSLASNTTMLSDSPTRVENPYPPTWEGTNGEASMSIRRSESVVRKRIDEIAEGQKGSSSFPMQQFVPIAGSNMIDGNGKPTILAATATTASTMMARPPWSVGNGTTTLPLGESSSSGNFVPPPFSTTATAPLPNTTATTAFPITGPFLPTRKQSRRARSRSPQTQTNPPPQALPISNPSSTSPLRQNISYDYERALRRDEKKRVRKREAAMEREREKKREKERAVDLERYSTKHHHGVKSGGGKGGRGRVKSSTGSRGRDEDVEEKIWREKREDNERRGGREVDLERGAVEIEREAKSNGATEGGGKVASWNQNGQTTARNRNSRFGFRKILFVGGKNNRNDVGYDDSADDGRRPGDLDLVGHSGAAGRGEVLHTTGLRFKQDSFQLRLHRYLKKLFYASTPSDSLVNRTLPSSRSGSSGSMTNSITSNTDNDPEEVGLSKRERRERAAHRAKRSQGGSSGDWDNGTTDGSGDVHSKKDDHLGDGTSDEWDVQRVVVDSSFDELPIPGAEEFDALGAPASSSGIGIDYSEISESTMRGQAIRGLRDLVRAVHELLINFFMPTFAEAESETSFQRERWHSNKLLAWLASAFLLLNWILYLIFNHNKSLYEKIMYYGVATLFTFPIPILVGYNAPRKKPLLFQIVVLLATWFWPISETIQTKVCHFYVHGTQGGRPRACGGKDFVFLMAYAIGLPALVLFSLNQNRIFALVGVVIEFILLITLVLPAQPAFVRNVVSFVVFSVFFLILHYMQEQIDRRTFILRSQLKHSYRVQQKAQIAEKQASLSKRRFVSYIFHEVRVPLNSAMLALQNLQASNLFEKCKEDQDVEVHALEGSLAMMHTVLSDVLDLNRMDEGKFISQNAPFPFHRTIQSMLGTLKSATVAKGLDLKIEFDERIDHLGSHQGDGWGLWVIGDAMRLRQVITNISSNAVKFTPAGKGSIIVKTELIYPGQSSPKQQQSSLTPVDSSQRPSPQQPTLSFEETNGNPSLLDQLQAQSPRAVLTGQSKKSNSVIVRISVTDSGPGIRASDLQESKLFSPYAQTQLGLKQAGKGSGLGLAIVRQIVTLSGGRLGVHSRKNSGSTFWVEFMYRMARPGEIQEQRRQREESWDPLAPPALSQPDPIDFKLLNVAAEYASEHRALATSSTTTAVGTTAELITRSPSDGYFPKLKQPSETDVGNDNTPKATGEPPTQTATDASALATESGLIRVPPGVLTTVPQSTPPMSTVAEVSFTGFKTPPLPSPPSLIKRPTDPTRAKPGADHPVLPALPSESPAPFATPPIKAEEPPSPASAGESYRSSNGTGDQSPRQMGEPLQVLVVDDDKLTRMLMQRMLTRLGCEVETANDGQQALDILLGVGQPGESGYQVPCWKDLVTLDNAMPVMTGQEAVSKLRGLGRDDYVVGITGNALLKDQIAYQEAGATQVLTKPVMVKDLKAILEVARQRRIQRQAPTTPQSSYFRTSSSPSGERAARPSAASTPPAGASTQRSPPGSRRSSSHHPRVPSSASVESP